MPEQAVTIFWFRRDLRLDDNAGLYHALKSGNPVQCLFIFDRNILDKLEDQDDSRLTFIHLAVTELDRELKKHGSSLLVKYNTAEKAWEDILGEFTINKVITNRDYEPYARERDNRIKALLENTGVEFIDFKDHVIFDHEEVFKDGGSPYTVFTPYKRRWIEKLKPQFHLKPYPTKKYFHFLSKNTKNIVPSLESMGFTKSSLKFPDKKFEDIIDDYAKTRDYPGIDGTSRISVHLRFGTISIRDAAAKAYEAKEKTWLNELIWRDFYSMILWHFPETVHKAFKPNYDRIQWRNNEKEFEAWCTGQTGYPIVDAGMRQLNTIGWMHNRIRMVTASFLSKHLLIDWRLGEAYFAKKLIDYEQASNVGGWQWAASSGNDAVPYFRIFNPEIQTKKFDPDLKYIKEWVPEFQDFSKYPQPIVDHKAARERALNAFKKALK
ncbi:deoxyribodipyrimidine photo-lyase [Pedobacter sp. HMF7647]|uniref:Deoxyribodipyrimidine photo-lyase n=1 Tax=Hufsiella arboris TaxID=2695275 RepID=A0A7K1YG30_9SPHI|nr:deoxyribodipyrimidine photo-lyase [Hufsiella arboris]MXV52949.1 deoxyribodipyrimidine photo-lyase [Hufsiella arboris]